jgi:hypothetical protein
LDNPPYCKERATAENSFFQGNQPISAAQSLRKSAAPRMNCAAQVSRLKLDSSGVLINMPA